MSLKFTTKQFVQELNIRTVMTAPPNKNKQQVIANDSWTVSDLISFVSAFPNLN